MYHNDIIIETVDVMLLGQNTQNTIDDTLCLLKRTCTNLQLHFISFRKPTPKFVNRLSN